MNENIICFVFGGYNRIRGTVYYCQHQEKTGYLTAEANNATLMSDEDISKLYSKLDKDILDILKNLLVESESDGYGIIGIEDKDIRTNKCLTIPTLLIDTVQRKLCDVKPILNDDYGRTELSTCNLILDIIKANNYFSDIINVNKDNTQQSVINIKCMIKTSYV